MSAPVSHVARRIPELQHSLTLGSTSAEELIRRRTEQQHRKHYQDKRMNRHLPYRVKETENHVERNPRNR